MRETELPRILGIESEGVLLNVYDGFSYQKYEMPITAPDVTGAFLLFQLCPTSDYSNAGSVAVPLDAARLFMEDLVCLRNDTTYQWIVSCETIAGDKSDLAAQLDVAIPPSYGRAKKTIEFSITEGDAERDSGRLRLGFKPNYCWQMTLPLTDARAFFLTINDYIAAYRAAQLTIRELARLGG